MRACPIVLALALGALFAACSDDSAPSSTAAPLPDAGLDAPNAEATVADAASDRGVVAPEGTDAGADAGDDARAPSVSDNPPIPAGERLMPQAEVTADMTTWAVEIDDDPVTYPMFATATKTFGALTVLARVEWHPPDFDNPNVHRGVTLYEPL